MFREIQNKYDQFEEMYGKFEGWNKALMFHRAFCEVCVERTRIARFLDNHIPLTLSRKDIHILHPDEMALNGLKILHLSDLHFYKGDSKCVDRLKKTIKHLNVDLVVLTGDYPKGQGEAQISEEVSQQVSEAISQTTSTHGVWATLGNHDDPSLSSAFTRAGIGCLESHAVRLFHNGHPILLSGFNPSYKNGERRAGIYHIHQGSPYFGIMLCHYTAYSKWIAESGYRVYLAGHSHGPQIAGHYHIGMGDKDKLSGIWRCSQMMGHTSNGIGTSLYPIRIGRKAEASVLTLRAENNM